VVTPVLILAALVGAIVWTHLCTHYGLPISVSHALIGGMAGAGLAKAGSAALVTAGFTKVAVFIVVSPLLGLLFGVLLMIAVTWICHRSNPWKVDRVFRAGQLLSSAAFSLGHGTNDAQKTMGIIAVLLYTQGYLGSEFHVPVWVILSAHAAIGLGTLAGGWRVIHTMGVRLTDLRPMGGFCAETAGAALLVGTAYAGIPVSTTHTIAGAIMGVGATRRVSAVKWGVAGRIVWAWVLTIPASAAVSALAYALLSRVL
jgi:PiT family inorganic phosphate transporter